MMPSILSEGKLRNNITYPVHASKGLRVSHERTCISKYQNTVFQYPSFVMTLLWK